MVLLRSADPVGEDEPPAGHEHGPHPVSVARRVRVLAMVTLGPLVTGYTVVAALFALVTSTASRARLDTAGVLTAAMPGWLAAHQVPVDIGGHVLGALPLLPTIAAVAQVGRAAAGAAHRLDLRTPKQAGQVVAVMVGGHAAFGLSLGLLCSGRAVTAEPLAALCGPALLAAVGSVAGVARYGGLVDLALDRVDAAAGRGLRVGVLVVAALLAAGAAVLAAGLVTSVPVIREMFARAGSGFGSGLGPLLLSAGYLPNAIVGGTSFAVGPGLSMGTISVTPLHATGGPPPGLPLLAALPEHAALWWPALLVLPAGAGVLAGRLLRDVADAPLARMRAVAVATGVVALSFAVLAAGAGGSLGGGAFDPLDLRAASLSVALVAWIGIPAVAVAWFGGARSEADGPAGLLDDPTGPEPGEETGDPDEETGDTGESGEPGETGDAAEGGDSGQDGGQESGGISDGISDGDYAEEPAGDRAEPVRDEAADGEPEPAAEADLAAEID